MPPPRNPSFSGSGSGTSDAFARAIARCKQEGVTVHGAVMVAVALAMAATAGVRLEDERRFKVGMEVDCNMRPRIKHRFPENHVGFFFNPATIDAFGKTGVAPTARFWDEARATKQETEKALRALPTLLTMFYAQESLHERVAHADVEIAKCVMTDVSLSNIGKYPFATRHAFGPRPSDAVHVKSVHVFVTMPNITPGCTLFLTAVGGTFHYSTMHKYPHATGRALLKWYMAFVEAIGAVGADDTLLQVSQRVRAAADVAPDDAP